MTTHAGVKIEWGDDVWVPVPNDKDIYEPRYVNMYDSVANCRRWFGTKEDCQEECDRENERWKGKIPR